VSIRTLPVYVDNHREQIQVRYEFWAIRLILLDGVNSIVQNFLSIRDPPFLLSFSCGPKNRIPGQGTFLGLRHGRQQNQGKHEKKDVSSQFHLRTCADWSGGPFLERCPECTPNRRDSESRRTDQTHGKPVLESSS